MRLYARTALALIAPALHGQLIDAEQRFNEHAFINTAIAERTRPIARTLDDERELNALIAVKEELQNEYGTITTPRKPR